jgi:BASS family bile acid:Na+ symporter
VAATLAFLAFLAGRAPLFLALGVFAGLFLPELATAARSLLEPGVVGLMTVSLLRLDWPALGRSLRAPAAALVAAVWLLVLTPLLAWILALALGLPAGLTTALVLNGAAPALIAAIPIALLVGLDAPLVVALVVITTLALPVTLMPVLLWLLDLAGALDLGAFFLRFAVYIVAPFAIAGILRARLGTARIEARAVSLDGVNVVLLVLCALGLMDGVTAEVLARPGRMFGFLVAAVVFNAGFQVLGALVFRGRGRLGALTVGLALGNRNMALMLVLMAGTAGPDFALYVAMAQLPIYLLPSLGAPIYRRLGV